MNDGSTHHTLDLHPAASARPGRAAAWMVLCLLLAPLIVSPASAKESTQEKIAKLKAAYLLNFCRYVEWPEEVFENSESPIVVGVVGEDEMGPILDHTLAERKVRGRPLVARRYQAPPRKDDEDERARQAALDELAGELRGVQLLFFTDAERDSAEAILDRTASQPILLVGDGQRYLELPTMLDLVFTDNRMVFYARREALRDSVLKVSSHLLRLAQLID